MVNYVDLGIKYTVIELDKNTGMVENVLSGPFDTEKEALNSMLVFISQGKQNLEVSNTHVLKMKDNY